MRESSISAERRGSKSALPGVASITQLRRRRSLVSNSFGPRRLDAARQPVPIPSRAAARPAFRGPPRISPAGKVRRARVVARCPSTANPIAPATGIQTHPAPTPRIPEGRLRSRRGSSLSWLDRPACVEAQAHLAERAVELGAKRLSIRSSGALPNCPLGALDPGKWPHPRPNHWGGGARP